ncbi:hypothetical protein BB560_003268 [Smittium megazygosporum]|uniref:Uncharacterized protein n=1 Tax=Smittium megazygosporum TaxID=133381 RepID=A0A2T9ZCF6_9FUNG|nr:hypothetical protein BB560_003268 [Smittium megazygosporum]
MKSNITANNKSPKHPSLVREPSNSHSFDNTALPRKRNLPPKQPSMLPSSNPPRSSALPPTSFDSDEDLPLSLVKASLSNDLKPNYPSHTSSKDNAKSPKNPEPPSPLDPHLTDILLDLESINFASDSLFPNTEAGFDLAPLDFGPPSNSSPKASGSNVSPLITDLVGRKKVKSNFIQRLDGHKPSNSPNNLSFTVQNQNIGSISPPLTHPHRNPSTSSQRSPSITSIHCLNSSGSFVSQDSLSLKKTYYDSHFKDKNYNHLNPAISRSNSTASNSSHMALHYTSEYPLRADSSSHYYEKQLGNKNSEKKNSSHLTNSDSNTPQLKILGDSNDLVLSPKSNYMLNLQDSGDFEIINFEEYDVTGSRPNKSFNRLEQGSNINTLSQTNINRSSTFKQTHKQFLLKRTKTAPKIPNKPNRAAPAFNNNISSPEIDISSSKSSIVSNKTISLKFSPYISSTGKQICSNPVIDRLRPENIVNPPTLSSLVSNYNKHKLGIIDIINFELLFKSLVDIKAIDIVSYRYNDRAYSNLSLSESRKASSSITSLESNSKSESSNKPDPSLNSDSIELIKLNLYFTDTTQYLPLTIASVSSVFSVLKILKRFNLIDPENPSWSIFDVTSDFSVERPLCYWESIGNIVKSWEPYSNNYMVVKEYPRYSKLFLKNSIERKDLTYSSVLHFRTIKFKWTKMQVEISNGSVNIFKPGKNKKEFQSFSLDNYDICIPYNPIKNSPSSFVFGLKPELPPNVYEKPEANYIKFFCTDSSQDLEFLLNLLQSSKNPSKLRSICKNSLVDSSPATTGLGTEFINEPLIHLDPDNKPSIHNISAKHKALDTVNKLVESEFIFNLLKKGILSDIDEEFFYLGSLPQVKNALNSGESLNDYSSPRYSRSESKEREGSYIQTESSPQSNYLISKIAKAPPKPSTIVRKESVFKKGSLLGSNLPRTSKPAPESSSSKPNSNKFTAGSLLATLPAKKQREQQQSSNLQMLNKPLLSLGDIDTKNDSKVNPYSDIGTYDAETVGTKKFQSKPLIRLIPSNQLSD